MYTGLEYVHYQVYKYFRFLFFVIVLLNLVDIGRTIKKGTYFVIFYSEGCHFLYKR